MPFDQQTLSERLGRVRLSPDELDARVSAVRAWVTNMRDSGGGPSNGAVTRHIQSEWPEMNQAEFDHVFAEGKRV